MASNHSDAPLSTFEQDLHALVPASGLDRDTLLFRAGQVSAQRGWFWPAAAGLMTAAAASLGVAWLLHPAPEPVIRTQVVQVVVHEPAPAPPPPRQEQVAERPPEPEPSPPNWPEYLRLRDQVVRMGADALPCPPLSASQPASTMIDADVLGIPAKDMIELERPVFARPRLERKWGGSL